MTAACLCVPLPAPQVLVCTLGMLASPKLQGSLLRKRSVGHMLVDEASQVYAGDYLLHFSHLTSLRSSAETQGHCLLSMPITMQPQTALLDGPIHSSPDVGLVGCAPCLTCVRACLYHVDRHMTFFGDDRQLPPFGSETTRVCSIFDSQRVWEECAWSGGSARYLCYDGRLWRQLFSSSRYSHR